MERIVFLERDTFKATFRRPTFAHEWIDYAETTRAAEVLERLQGATIAICNKVTMDEATLARLPNLRLIAVAATGVDNIDLAYCRRRGLAVSNARNYARHSVPEHALMLMLALRRNLLSYRADIERGLWQQARQFCLLNHTVRDLHESTLGIIGYGALGQAVEKLARALGMKTLISEHKNATTIRQGRKPFAEVLDQSDIITLHCPLMEETRGMFGREEFASMQRHALLINTARGGLVNEQALVEALRSGLIAGAGFDVLSREPPREGNPLLELDQPNFILTPHVAWASDEAMQALADQVLDNIEAFVQGTPQNLV
ncbi:MAG TPA: D-2-hydroxyacid dehydrogenase [Pyrinomonadaceae bacterium]|jgi:glycerate dehydrogenase